jgi:exodeoxyribonuclease VII small subunit
LAENPQSDAPPPESDAEQAVPFEQALEELESLVERLESGEGSLEQALADFERGIHLARQCEARLTEAEQTVQQLVGEGEDGQLAPFSTGDPDGETGGSQTGDE